MEHFILNTTSVKPLLVANLFFFCYFIFETQLQTLALERMRQNVEPLYWLRHSSTRNLNSNLILSAIVFRLHLCWVETIILNGPEWVKQECNLIPPWPCVSQWDVLFTPTARLLIIFQLCNYAQFWTSEWVSCGVPLKGCQVSDSSTALFSHSGLWCGGKNNSFTMGHLYLSVRKVRC